MPSNKQSVRQTFSPKYPDVIGAHLETVPLDVVKKAYFLQTPLLDSSGRAYQLHCGESLRWVMENSSLDFDVIVSFQLRTYGYFAFAKLHKLPA